MAGAGSSVQDDLEAIADALEAASFRLPFDDRADHEKARRDLATSVRRFLLPRVADTEAPVVGLLTGPTGSGKSTLLNSLAGRRLSATGPVRPTTVEPVIWAHRRHAGRYWQEFVARVEEHAGPSAEIIVGDEPLLEDLTLVDSPPLPDGDGPEMLELADLCIFVTSATRYADARTWELLDSIRGKGLPVLFVINRVPRDASSSRAVVEDFADKLAAARFLPSPDPAQLFVVYEHRIDVSTDGLPPGSVAGLRQELMELGDDEVRHQLASAAVSALAADLGRRSKELAALARLEAGHGRELLAMAERSYNARIAAIGTDLEHGRFAELATDWQPDLLATRLARHIGTAAQESASAWSEDPVGRRLVAGPGEGLWQASPQAEEAAATALAAWEVALRRLAAERSRRGRMVRFRRKRFAVRLREGALTGAGAAVDPKLAKRYGDQGAVAVVRAARSALLEAVGEAFQADASRFRAAVGPIERLEVMAGVLDDKAGALGARLS